MPDVLDFTEKRDEGSESWERADPLKGTVAQLDWRWWAVFLPDGDMPHIVRLERERGAYLGFCDCKGFEYSDGPCAHLCTIRKAEFLGIEDAAGEVVRVANRDQARADHHVERARADGGERR